MNDVLDRLRADNPVQVGSAPSIDRVWDRLPHTSGTRRRRRPIVWRTAAAALSLLIPLVVIVLAFGLLGHGRPTTGSTSRSPLGSGITKHPRAVPTLSQLLANFAVLRRPQAAADRAWRPDDPANARTVARFTRLARRLPNGDRIFLSILRFMDMGGRHIPLAGTYSLNLDIVSPHGDDASVSFIKNVNYTVIPISSAPLGTAGGRLSAWASIIPDDVARVRWKFGCPVARRCGQEHPLTVTVPVRGDVAAATVPGTSQACGRVRRQCRTPVGITWYAGDGRVLARYRPLHDNLSAPPFVR